RGGSDRVGGRVDVVRPRRRGARSPRRPRAHRAARGSVPGARRRVLCGQRTPRAAPRAHGVQPRRVASRTGARPARRRQARRAERPRPAARAADLRRPRAAGCARGGPQRPARAPRAAARARARGGRGRAAGHLASLHGLRPLAAPPRGRARARPRAEGGGLRRHRLLIRVGVEHDGCRCPGVTWPRLTGDHHMTDLTTLRSTTDAEVLFPGDAAYEAVRPAYYGAGDPAAIIRPTTTEQVADALRLAREQGLGVSVRSGGHAARAFPNPDGLVIDMA